MKKIIHNLLIICFICYIILLVYFLFFSERYGRDQTYSSYQYNLQLFREIKRYLAYRGQIGKELFIINVVGNVAAFMPMGFFVPVLYREQRGENTYRGHFVRSGIFVTLFGFLISFSVETIQLVTKVGCFDVDDLLMNTTGVLLGFLLYYICKQILAILPWNHKKKKKKREV